MAESVLEVIVDLVPLLLGPLMVEAGRAFWRTPDDAPAVATGGPVWLVRCWAVGFGVLGLTVAALGGYGLLGREEPAAIGLVRLSAVAVVLASMAAAAVYRLRAPYGTAPAATGGRVNARPDGPDDLRAAATAVPGRRGPAYGAGVKRTRLRSEVMSVTAWWALLTVVLWATATLLGHRTTLWGCAASVAVFVALGEAGDRLRRCRARRTRRGDRRTPGDASGL
ncbi:hypothetical protein [Streptomyces thermolilacinus]|uniref:hypothetical protein n=1 Tax=Streptomyces thermolilacinus TaxID=285540 RepID=UPI0033E01178